MSKGTKVFLLSMILGILAHFIAKGLIVHFQIEFFSLPDIMAIAFLGLFFATCWLLTSGHKLL